MMKPLVDFRDFSNAPKIPPPCSLSNGLYLKVLMKTTHCDIHTDLTDCDGLLNVFRTPRLCSWIILGESVELPLVCVRNFVGLGSEAC